MTAERVCGTCYYVHTSNKGWTEHPNGFAHISRALGVHIVVQYDPAIHDHEYRVYAGTVPIGRTTPIEADCGRRIKHAIAKHLAHPPSQSHEADKPTTPVRAEEVTPMVEPDPEGQMRIALPGEEGVTGVTAVHAQEAPAVEAQGAGKGEQLRWEL